MTNKNAILKEIKALKNLLTEDLDAWDRRTLPGKLAQHAQARTRLGELMREYDKTVQGDAAVVFITGTQEAQEAFAKTATDVSPGVIIVDGRGIYKSLSKAVWPINRDQLDFAKTSILATAFSIQAEKAGLRIFNCSFTKLLDRPFFTEDSLIDALRERIQADVGVTVNNAYISQEIIDRAFEVGATASPVPCVILYTGEGDRDALSSIFGARSVVVNVEGAVTPNTVTKAFNELKKTLKKLNPTNTSTTENEEN